MARLSRRFSLVCALCLSAALMAGCPPPDDEPEPDTGTQQDVGVDGGADDAGDDLCSDNEDCDGDKVCNAESGECVECLSDSDCSGQNFVCNTEENSCELQAKQCQQAGDSCNPDDSAPIGSDFECVDDGTGEGPECMPKCPDGSCPAGKVCLRSAPSSDAASVCFPSQCDGPQDTESCSDASGHALFGDYGENGAKCATVGGANICVPNGGQAEGEKCLTQSPAFCPEDVSDENCRACQAGNVCIGGKCEAACGADGDCSDNACLGLETDGVAGTGGFCGESCPAFSRGECSEEGEGCRALTTNVAYCDAVGDSGYMESCEPGSQSNPAKRSCKEGMNCVLMQGEPGGDDAVARCVPQCNPPAQDASDTTENDLTCGGTANVRFVYLSGTTSSLDIYIDGNEMVSDLGKGNVSDADGDTSGKQYLEVSAGEREIQLVDGEASDNSDPELTINETLTGGMDRTFLITKSGDSNITTQKFPVVGNVPQPEAETSSVRVGHAATGITDDDDNAVNVDVVATDSETTDPSQGTELVADAAAGDVTGFAEVASGTYTIHVFETGADRSSADPIAEFTEVNLGAEERFSVYLHGDASGDGLAAKKVKYLSPPYAPDYSCLSTERSPDSNSASGLCLDECAAQEYGKGSCPGSDNACNSVSGDSYCLPTQGAAEGESCDIATSGFVSGCEEGAFCETYGDGEGSGKCISECVGGGSSNSVLQCGENRTCAADSGNVGECQQSCSPGDSFFDSECPENLQSCLPESTTEDGVEGAYCSASGSKSEGDSCGGSETGLLVQNCGEGLTCSYPSGTEDQPLAGNLIRRTGSDAPDATCRPSCDPFADDPGCSDGSSCVPDLVVTGGSDSYGTCLEDGSDLGQNAPATGASCGSDDVGSMCGQASFCSTQQGQTFCLQFCDIDAEENICAENTSCEAPPTTGEPINGTLGICQSNN